MRILVFGAGAIGTYIGGSLALHGHHVVFLERPGVATELRRNGLRLNLAGHEQRIARPKIAASPDEALGKGHFDVAVFALKAYDTRPALEGLEPYAEALPPVLCLQNGVENEPLLREVLGDSKVIAGTVTSAIGRRAAGNIVLERRRGLGVAARHPLSAELTTALDAAGLNARLYPDAARMKWSKLLTNLLANATSAILDLTPAEVFDYPGLFRLEIEQLRETLRVMAAQGLHPVDLPKTPVRALGFAARWLPLVWGRIVLRRSVGSGRGGKMPSLHIDLHSGRSQSEVEYLNGAVVRFGEKLGIPTPVNRLLSQTLLALTRGEQDLSIYRHKPERLLVELKTK
ncbi:MAG TPA: 2-dehydropantoate 2-reductase [Anaerolineales bacterium]|nr:2-dehydropantoate 2-reductase [Anaerolineales bacterium]